MKKHNINSIWQKPSYLPYVQPILTDEMVASAENQLGYSLPTALIELLKIQNGGYIRYKLPELPHELISGIGYNFPSLTEFNWQEAKEYVSFELEGLIPFDGDGHWYLCLDYRNNSIDPKISFIDIECDNEEVIANSFSDYLSLLELDTECKFVIQTNNTIEQIAKDIENTLSIKFEKPDNTTYGYTSYRSKFKNSWLWLTPNKVVDSFIRKEDKAYKQAINKMNTIALRYPEIDEKALFLEFSDEDCIDEVTELLSNNNLVITALEALI